MMASEANILRFPPADEKITCHVRIPNVSQLLGTCEDNASGMSHVAVAMQHVAERFDDLAILFEECPDATVVSGTHFLDGHYTFVFQIPRRYRKQLVDMGWDSIELDV
jgi:hypothetical protein